MPGDNPYSLRYELYQYPHHQYSGNNLAQPEQQTEEEPHTPYGQQRYMREFMPWMHLCEYTEKIAVLRGSIGYP